MAYNYGTSYTTEFWDLSGGDGDNTTEANILFNPNTNALLPEFGCGTDGPNTFTLHIKTTADDNGTGAFTRNTAWRKAYRFINRFDVGTVNMDRKAIDGNSTPTPARAEYKTNRSFAESRNGFELPFDHNPPCRFPVTESSNPNGSRSLIEMLYSINPTMVDTDDDWDGTLDDDPGVEWSIGKTGLRLIENSTPESIEFTVRKLGTTAIKMDTSTAIIPAYSGEILSFQDGDGVGYVGRELGDDNNPVTKIYIDITETDEILRWDPDNASDSVIIPHDWWSKTFSSIQLKNADNTSLSGIVFKKSTMKVESQDKNNYVVSFTSPSLIPMSSWDNGDTIRVEFKRKRTIPFGVNTKPWNGAEYESIRYRNLADEFQDDTWVQVPPEPPIETGACCIDGVCEQKTAVQCSEAGGDFFEVGSTDCIDCGDDGGSESSEILPFTATLNGTLDDGTITINYPGDFNATGIKFEVYIEKDPDLPVD